MRPMCGTWTGTTGVVEGGAATPVTQRVRGALRSLGNAAVAGVATGIIVAGLGGRLVMKIVALIAGPGAMGNVTANGNTVGDFTLNGTMALVIFSGVFEGLIGGLLYVALRPWLERLGRWRGLAFGVVVLALMGHAVLEPGNGDFRRFGPVGLNVALFAALFLLYGVTLAPVFDAIARGADRSRVVAAIAWLGVIPGTLIIVLGVGGTVAGLLGLNPDFRPAFGLAIVGTLVVGMLGRLLGPRNVVARALVAAVLLAGVLVTGTDIARILFDRPVLPG